MKVKVAWRKRGVIQHRGRNFERRGGDEDIMDSRVAEALRATGYVQIIGAPDVLKIGRAR